MPVNQERTEVHFTEGDLYRAFRASTGIPGVFTPVDENESPAILNKLRGFFNSSSKNDIKTPEAVLIPTFSMFELLNASYDATLDRLVEVMLENSPADVLVEVLCKVCPVFEFYRSAELINIGKTAYTNAMVKSGLKERSF